MSKFDELKKAAEAAIDREDCDRFIERDDAQAVLELLAIQAQLVEALKDFDAAVSNLSGFGMRKDRERLVTCLVAARRAVDAAEARP